MNHVDSIEESKRLLGIASLKEAIMVGETLLYHYQLAMASL